MAQEEFQEPVFGTCCLGLIRPDPHCAGALVERDRPDPQFIDRLGIALAA
jgi:hypothetical protein